MNQLLIVEDDINLRNELKTFLINNGYEVKCLESFEHSLKDILSMTCDLILMDINIPGVNGEFLCKEIRKEKDTPIIMLTSSKNEMDELVSMTYGADDYIVKPYNPQILLVRIEAVLKRMNRNESLTLNYHDLTLNISKSLLEYQGNSYELSKNETRILNYLLKHKGQIVSREEIMEYLWGNEEFVDDNTLTVNITRIRKKLEEIGFCNVIETRRGQGYIIL